ncbi:MAG: hypothetical protein WCY47_03160 [Pusillimonas sp.]
MKDEQVPILKKHLPDRLDGRQVKNNAPNNSKRQQNIKKPCKMRYKSQKIPANPDPTRPCHPSKESFTHALRCCSEFFCQIHVSPASS